MTDEEKKAREKKLNDLRWVLSTPQGRRFLWGLMADCRVFNDRFYSDERQSEYMKGRRIIGQDLFHDILEAEPNSYLKMQQEQDAKEVREVIKLEKNIKEKLKNPTQIDSPSLPNTELVTGQGATR